MLNPLGGLFFMIVIPNPQYKTVVKIPGNNFAQRVISVFLGSLGIKKIPNTIIGAKNRINKIKLLDFFGDSLSKTFPVGLSIFLIKDLSIDFSLKFLTPCIEPLIVKS
jgi:hypothetical protein